MTQTLTRAKRHDVDDTGCDPKGAIASEKQGCMCARVCICVYVYMYMSVQWLLDTYSSHCFVFFQ